MTETCKARALGIKTKDELAQSLGYSTKELTRIANSKKRYYRVGQNPTSTGKPRTFYKPIGPLRSLLKVIKKELLDKVELPECMHHRKKRSYVTNAKAHVGNGFLLRLDIKDFFPSISFQRVRKTLVDLGCSEEVSCLLTHLVTCDYHLPQGFPTSPALSGLVASNLARRVQGLCETYNLTFTMYVDDISISGNIEEPKFKSLVHLRLLPLIKEFAKQEEFLLNRNKISISGKRDRREVTGIVVNRKPNIRKQKRTELVLTIQRLRKHGIPVRRASEAFALRKSLRGKIANVQNVNPSLGQRFLAEFEKIDWSRRAA